VMSCGGQMQMHARTCVCVDQSTTKRMHGNPWQGKARQVDDEAGREREPVQKEDAVCVCSDGWVLVYLRGFFAVILAIVNVLLLLVVWLVWWLERVVASLLLPVILIILIVFVVVIHHLT